MKRKEITETFMMISNWKKLAYKNISAFWRLNADQHKPTLCMVCGRCATADGIRTQRLWYRPLHAFWSLAWSVGVFMASGRIDLKSNYTGTRSASTIIRELIQVELHAENRQAAQPWNNFQINNRCIEMLATSCAEPGIPIWLQRTLSTEKTPAAIASVAINRDASAHSS